MTTIQQLNEAQPPIASIRVKTGDPYAWMRRGQPANLHLLERVASIALGFAVFAALGRRLYTVGGVIALGLFLLYRGLTGFCPATAYVQSWRIGQASTTQTGIGMGETVVQEMAHDLRETDEVDIVDVRSWESFPASDPPSSP
jgi:hypothetical protein